MANEIYHRSNWGNAVNTNDWGDVYENFDATNEMYLRSDYYENSNETDKLMAAINPKPSILLTPTAYDNGSLHSVKPVQSFGSELSVNGDFATDSDWTKGTNWSIANGKATVTNSTTSSIFQDILNVSKKYKVTFEITEITSGSLRIGIGQNFSDYFTQVGTYTYYGKIFLDTLLRINPSSGTNASIDYVSVKEVIDADFDFTRGSSATRVNEKGLIESVTDTNLPRIDYTSGTGSLKLEPQRTNSFPYSEDFANSDWTKDRLSITGNSIISPDGTLNASKITENTENGTHRISDTIIVSGTDVAYTQSVFAKSGGNGRYLRMFRGSGTYNNAVFDLENGTVVAQGGSRIINTKIETYPNGWYRCISTYTTQFGNIATYYGLQNGNTDSYQGDGTSHIYLWGAQLEEGSYSTSIIPTSGSTVTRLADVCNNAGSSDLINSTEGVLYAEVSKNTTTIDGGIAISDGSTDNRILLYFDTSGNIRAYVYASGEQARINTSGLNYTLMNKIAIKYSATSTKFFVNGNQVGSTDTSSNMPSGLSELAFDNGGGGSDFYGNVKTVAVFKEALSDTELQKLTT